MTLDLNLVRAFIAVHDLGSFSAAAERFGVPRSTLSRAVSALEEELGVSLFNRTTRKVVTTAAGSELYDRVARPFGELEASLADLPEREEEPAGVLRLTATGDVATLILAEAVTRYCARYPKTQVEVRVTNTMLDLVKDRIDLAVRIASGKLRDSTLVVRSLGAVMIHLYASPSYLARAGTPRTPLELADHELVGSFGVTPFAMRGRDSKLLSGSRARIMGDDMFFARETARHGAGVACLPSFMADSDVTAGRLVRVLPRFRIPAGTMLLVQPSRKHVPRGVTAFRDLLLELMRKRPP